MANTGNTQQQINYGASANDGQGDPLRTAFIKTDDNFDNVWLAGPVGSNITIGNNTIQSNNTNGNIILKPNGTGIVQANASIIPNADGVRDLGSSTQAWRRAYIDELLPTDLTVSGDAVINGNLTVQGDTIQIGNITTDTLTIQLANTAANAAAATGAGITVGASDNIATILYNATANRWNVSVGMSAVGNISAPYFSGNGSLLTGITSYGNANVAANLAAFANNPISTTGTVNTGNIIATGSFTTNSAGNVWNISNDFLSFPSGASWRSDKFTLDEYIQSAVDGYLNLQTFDNTSNVATEFHMEHGIVQLNIYNGNNVTWEFDSTGNLTLPGNTFAVNYANGSAVNLGGNYGNANVAANLAAFSNNPISTTGNVSIGNIIATGNFTANSSGNVWNISNDFLSFPSGASWRSDKFTLDEYISSATDGYLNLQTYDNTSNVATELHMEHGVVQFNIYNGTLKTWNFNENGSTTFPGDVLPLANLGGSLGNSSLYWSNLWVANNTIYIGGVPLGMTAGNVLTVDGNTITGTVTFSNEAVIGTGTSNTVSGLYLAPDPVSLTNDLFLRVRGNIQDEPTHIHFDTGNNQYYNQFIGDDNKYVQLANTGNIVINASDYAGNTAQWTFGTDGLLTFPDGTTTTGDTVVAPDVYDIQSIGNTLIQTSAAAGAKTWTFGTDGSLTFPNGATIKDTVGNAVAFGRDAAATGPQGNAAVAIGQQAGETSQGLNAVAIGALAGTNTQNANAVAIGRQAGSSTQGTSAVAVGTNAGQTSQGDNSVAIGVYAAANAQGQFAVAIGDNAGNNAQGTDAVAIGASAGLNTQGAGAVALGQGTGETSQGNNAVALGKAAGQVNQGINSIAIGQSAGLTNQGNNSIILNATGSALEQTTANTFTVAPVRNDVANVAEILFYDTTSKEVTYGNVISVAGNITGGNISTAGNISGNTAGYAIGYRDIPQVAFTGNATIATTDAGKHFYSTQSTDYILTIANNASQGFATGAAITVINQGTGNITLAQGSGVTLYLTGNATSGNRTVSTFGMATLIKVATDTWFVSGAGVI